MERQILIVDGGEARLARAARDRWRARNQRDKWLDEKLSHANQLAELDDKLVEEWQDRHGPMCADLAMAEESAKREQGRNLLDWTHDKAPVEIALPRPGFDLPFVVRGSYQQLSEERKVGWHPDYAELLDIDFDSEGEEE